MKETSIGIIGGGVLGQAIKAEFLDAKIYDKYVPFQTLEEVLDQEYIFVCVPTPYNENGFDRSILDEVMEQAAEDKKERTVIIKSTVIPGTSDYYQDLYPYLNILFNPEFLTENTAVRDFRFPDRQIVGYTKSKVLAQRVLQILPPGRFNKVVPAKTAELIKYFTNTWYATKVIFSNQMFDLCELMGVNYDDVREAAASDRMTGKYHLDVWHKGYRGYGGKCLVKDTRSLIDYAKDEHDLDMELLIKVEELNNKIKEN